MLSWFFGYRSEAASSNTAARNIVSTSEAALLALAKSRYSPPNSDVTFKVHDVSIPGLTSSAGPSSIHTVEVLDSSRGAAPSSQPPVVILHGYGNGVGYLYRNLAPLAARLSGRKVVAIDLHGFGLSSRPDFLPSPTSPPLPPGVVHPPGSPPTLPSAEEFFVASLESWRVSQNFPSIVLAGHSLGGYLACAYAERHPESVSRLVLLSPVGVPKYDEDDFEGKFKQMPWRYRLLITAARSLWSLGFTPMQLIRALPEGRGRQLVSGYVNGRLAVLEDDERKVLADYFYGLCAMKGSGEFCLQHLLRPGAYAYSPLLDRIPKLKVPGGVSFIYGQHDWMGVEGGLDVSERISEQSKGADKCDVRVVRKAGHLLMLENSSRTTSVLADAILGGDLDVETRLTIKRDENGRLVWIDSATSNPIRGTQQQAANAI